jgi:hypothetical protein
VSDRIAAIGAIEWSIYVEAKNNCLPKILTKELIINGTQDDNDDFGFGAIFYYLYFNGCK